MATLEAKAKALPPISIIEAGILVILTVSEALQKALSPIFVKDSGKPLMSIEHLLLPLLLPDPPNAYLPIVFKEVKLDQLISSIILLWKN